TTALQPEPGGDALRQARPLDARQPGQHEAREQAERPAAVADRGMLRHLSEAARRAGVRDEQQEEAEPCGCQREEAEDAVHWGRLGCNTRSRRGRARRAMTGEDDRPRTPTHG